jgi:hypothetical protein
MGVGDLLQWLRATTKHNSLNLTPSRKDLRANPTETPRVTMWAGAKTDLNKSQKETKPST